MASTYFGSFPYITYTLDPQATQTNDVVTNIFRRVAFTETVLKTASSFYPYQIKESDTPESIAHKYYSDPQYFWLVTLVNNITDPILDWPLNHNDFTAMIENKYGSVANAQSQIAHYVMEIVTNSSNADIASASTFIDQISFDRRGLPVLPYDDYFTRTEVGPDYQILPGHNVNLPDPISGFIIANNALATTGAGAALLSHDMPTDQYIEATIGPVANNTGRLTLGVRTGITHDKLSGYFADISCNGANVMLYKYEEFDWVTLSGKTILTEYNFAANGSVAVAANDVYRVEAYGDLITVHRSGNLIISTTDVSSMITGTKGMIGLQTPTSVTSLTVGPEGLLGFQEDFQKGMIGQNPYDHRSNQDPSTDFRYWNDQTHIWANNGGGIFVSSLGKTTTGSTGGGTSQGFMTANTKTSPDHGMACIVGTFIANDPAFFQLAVRGTTDNVANHFTGYDYQITSNGSFSLQRSVTANGEPNQGGNVWIVSGVSSPFGQIAPGDKLEVTAVGSTISYLRNDVLEYAYVDPSPIVGTECGWGLKNGSPGSVTADFHITDLIIRPILPATIYQFPVLSHNLAFQTTEVAGRVYSFNDGTTVTTTINTGPITMYDAEVIRNDQKRNIKILKKEYLLQARQELNRLTETAQ